MTVSGGEISGGTDAYFEDDDWYTTGATVNLAGGNLTVSGGKITATAHCAVYVYGG